jgi:hypothetical protein
LIFLAITPLKSLKNAAEYREKGRARKGSGAYQRGGTIGGFNQLLKYEVEHGEEAAARWGGAAIALRGRSLAMASRLFRGFDFLSAFMAFLFGPRMELKPIPVRVRRPRR